MKLLIDQNLSHRIAKLLEDYFPEIVHIKEIALEKAKDEEVWRYARENGFSIVTKDSNFNDLAVVRGFPPKIIWIQKGNCSTDDIISLLKKNHKEIIEFIEDKENSILIIS